MLDKIYFSLERKIKQSKDFKPYLITFYFLNARWPKKENG